MRARIARILLAFVWLLISPIGAGGQERPDGQRLYQDFVDKGFKQPEAFVRQLDPLQRKAVIDHIFHLQGLETHGKNYGDATLFYFGEPSARKRYVERARSTSLGWGFSTVARSGDPTIIEEVAADMFSNEAMRNVGGEDLLEPPGSFRIANLITHILSHSPDFTDEVRQWAEKQTRMSHGMGETGERYREVMRQWWVANADFFKKKNYLAVKPGHDLMQDILDRMAARQRMAENSPKNVAGNRMTTPPVASTKADISPVSTGIPMKTEPREPERGLVKWLLGAIVTAMVVAFLWRKRQIRR